MTVAAIMQPTFLPWLGYFAMIDHVDQFVFLDDVQLSRQSWQTRNRICGPDDVLWLSLEVRRKPSRPPINAAQFTDSGFEKRIISTLYHSLSNAPFRDCVVDVVQTAFELAEGNVAALNCGVIEGFCRLAGIETPRHRVGDLTLTDNSSRTARLIEICQSLGATQYLSPPSALAYLREDGTFSDSGVELTFFNYSHPFYQQRGKDFEPYMSAVEAMAAVGPDTFRELAKSGVGPNRSMAELIEREVSRV